MFENIGGKIKTLAGVMFAIGAIVSIFAAIALMIGEKVGAGFILMIAGPLVAWISSWVLYGFGELIDKVCEIAENTGIIASNTSSNQETARHIKNVSTTKNSNRIMDIPKRMK